VSFKTVRDLLNGTGPPREEGREGKGRGEEKNIQNVLIYTSRYISIYIDIYF